MSLFDHRSLSVAPLLTIRFAAIPMGKQRPRSRIARARDGRQFVHVYTPTETRDFEDALRAVALDAMAGRPALDGPLEVLIFSYTPIPDSWPERRREAAVAGAVRPTGRPDWENIGKICCDALNPYRDPRTKIRIPVVWSDDAIVVDGRVVKLYARRQAGLVIEIRRAGLAPVPWSAA